jgi:cytidyltransferase-like protein
MDQTNNNNESYSKKTGLVLGRFQPLHPGHLELIHIAMQKCDEVVVCIGSAQLAEPFTVEQRHNYLQRQLEVLHPGKNWRLVDLVDPEPIDTWPEDVKQQCGITGDENIFYRSDQLPEVYETKLKDLGFTIKYVPRVPFYYWFPDGLHRRVNSATEIKAIFEELGVEIPYSFSQAKDPKK